MRAWPAEALEAAAATGDPLGDAGALLGDAGGTLGPPGDMGGAFGLPGDAEAEPGALGDGAAETADDTERPGADVVPAGGLASKPPGSTKAWRLPPGAFTEARRRLAGTRPSYDQAHPVYSELDRVLCSIDAEVWRAPFMEGIEADWEDVFTKGKLIPSCQKRGPLRRAADARVAADRAKNLPAGTRTSKH